MTAPKLLREASSLDEVVQLYAAETYPGVPRLNYEMIYICVSVCVGGGGGGGVILAPEGNVSVIVSSISSGVTG